MRVIKLDASGWRTLLDFYEALLLALEAPHWHGRNLNALIDSMIHGGINGIDPPYRIWVVGAGKASTDARTEMELAFRCLDETQGAEKDIEFQIDP